LPAISRRYVIFAIVGSALMMVSIDMTIAAVALPTILVELDTPLALASWALIANQLTQTIVLPFAGKLGDRWGRKRLLLWSVVLFGVGSIGAGLSPDIYVLILFRVVQAVGAGMFFPCAAGIVGDVFVEGRQTAVGLFVTIFQVGGVIGPNLGGVITDVFSWRGVFFINVPFCIVILILGVLLIPRDKIDPAAKDQRLDTTGAALLGSGVFSFLFGLTWLANHPDDLLGPLPFVCFFSSVLLLYLFVRQEGRTPEPIVDLKLVRWKPFLACNAQLFMWSGCFNGFFNFIPYYAAIAYGMSATQGGAILTPRSVMAVVLSLIASIFVAKLGYRRPWLVGLYLMALSMMFMGAGVGTAVDLGLGSPFIVMSMFTFIGGLAIGIAIPPAQAAYFDLRPDLMASAAGFRAMAGNSGGVLGTTIVTLFLSQFDDKVLGIQIIFFAMGVVVLISQFWVFMVPDRQKEPRALKVDPSPAA
jgi:EmrB/QacA subfamily drug resistance transporter